MVGPCYSTGGDAGGNATASATDSCCSSAADGELVVAWAAMAGTSTNNTPMYDEDDGGNGYDAAPGRDHHHLQEELLHLGSVVGGVGAGPGGGSGGGRMYPCPDCDKVFRHPRSYYQHQHVHRGTHSCPGCRKLFSRRWDLLRHLNKNKYGCPARWRERQGQAPSLHHSLSLSALAAS
ncbi:unnamed protein product, partial [Meganyctiphanes norvegica]